MPLDCVWLSSTILLLQYGLLSLVVRASSVLWAVAYLELLLHTGGDLFFHFALNIKNVVHPQWRIKARVTPSTQEEIKTCSPRRTPVPLIRHCLWAFVLGGCLITLLLKCKRCLRRSMLCLSSSWVSCELVTVFIILIRPPSCQLVLISYPWFDHIPGSNSLIIYGVLRQVTITRSGVWFRINVEICKIKSAWASKRDLVLGTHRVEAEAVGVMVTTRSTDWSILRGC